MSQEIHYSAQLTHQSNSIKKLKVLVTQTSRKFRGDRNQDFQEHEPINTTHTQLSQASFLLFVITEEHVEQQGRLFDYHNYLLLITNGTEMLVIFETCALHKIGNYCYYSCLLENIGSQMLISSSQPSYRGKSHYCVKLSQQLNPTFRAL